jgi:hypothetical protein
MRASLAIVLFGAILAGCGTSDSEQRDARISKCVDRALRHATTSGGNEQQARRYIKDTYCARFERNGWVYEDGALSIAAQTWLDDGGRCATASAGKPARTVPCEKANRDTATGTIDCALLHDVRRTEVIAYVAELQREGDVQCDDGTSLEELGVP